MNRRAFLGLAGGATATALSGCLGGDSGVAKAKNSGSPVGQSDFFTRLKREHIDTGEKFYVGIRDDHDVNPTGDAYVRAGTITAVLDPSNDEFWSNDGPATKQVVPSVNGYWLNAYDEGVWTINARGERVTEDTDGVYTEVVINSITVDTEAMTVIDSNVERIAER